MDMDKLVYKRHKYDPFGGRVQSVENSQTEAEFAHRLQEWQRCQLCRVYLWEIRECANLNTQQEQWLTNCIKETHGETAAGHYTDYISNACALVYDITGESSVLFTLCQMRPTAEYIENLKSICNEYCIDIGKALTPETLEKYARLDALAGADMAAYLTAAADAGQHITKRDFLLYIETHGGRRFCSFLSEVAREMGLNMQQAQWLQEYETAAAESETQTDSSRPERPTAAAPQPEAGPDSSSGRASTQTGAKTKGERLYQDFFNAITDEQRARVEKYFPRAISAGYMVMTESGLRWNGKRAQIAWFIAKALGLINGRLYANDTGRYMAKIDRLFGVKNIRVAMDAINQVQDIRSFETEMEQTIFYD